MVAITSLSSFPLHGLRPGQACPSVRDHIGWAGEEEACFAWWGFKAQGQPCSDSGQPGLRACSCSLLRVGLYVMCPSEPLLHLRVGAGGTHLPMDLEHSLYAKSWQ